MDSSVMGEKIVGNPCQPADRFVVCIRDRLVTQVAARHHESGEIVPQQQVMEGRRWDMTPNRH